MKKKILYFAIPTVVLVLAIIFYSYQSKPQVFENVQIADESEEQSKETSAPLEEPEPENEEEEQQDSSLPEFLSVALQNTVDFFTNDETRIVGIGDSLTQGVGDETEQGGYIGILDRSINKEEEIAKFDNFGVRGNRTDQLLGRLEVEEIALAVSDADIVLITIGANDIMQVAKENITDLDFEDFVEEQQQYEENLRAIIDKIRDLNGKSEIYLVGFYNPFTQYFEEIKELKLIVDNWNTIGAEVISDYDNAEFIPTDDLFLDDTVHLYAEDNFHPNYKGYFRMAERVLDYLR